MNVATLAKSLNGYATWTFSQGDLAVWRHYRTMGICAALSAHWIKHHANDGSLANVLGGGGVGPLKVGTLKEIALLHRTVSTTGDEQRENLKLWLQMHDIISLNTSHRVTVTNHRLNRDVVQAQSRTSEVLASGSFPNIENDLVTAMRKHNTCYARINFGGTFLGRGAGHAVAVWLGQPSWSDHGDALFFDPNYGEYWFKKKEDFFRFFPLYYRATYRSFPFSFDKNWELLPCAKKVR
jgi:Yersinia/Haemophilus virulence surface antigen